MTKFENYLLRAEAGCIPTFYKLIEKICFTRINFFARKTPKNHSHAVDLNKAVVRKGDKRGI